MKVAILKKTYTNEASGEIIPYERLALTGFVGGELHSLELKLNSSELMLAKILLQSEEESADVHSRKATKEEEQEFKSQNEPNFLDD